ncbi:Lin0368 family putative glycerol transporter subunit [Thermovenabulum gondwanense]|uniref:Uncharacterized protein n=1 Tax=Thermovenabulum gondwanense TaxID=520767 RepID=A0A162MEB9_9FIRM|nr:hypothetical protein [Thermovenabulum gondwanense]KYO65472.1 hypothetical protein ATZ99_15080 [Thermovenabulum gondwanense]
MWTWQHVLTTIFGGIIFPLVIGMVWGKLVEDYKSFGGVLAGFFIVGTIWLLNHGIGLMYEPQMNAGGAWSDMAIAAFWGLFVADLFAGKKIDWEVIISGVLGGVLGGLLLFAMV